MFFFISSIFVYCIQFKNIYIYTQKNALVYKTNILFMYVMYIDVRLCMFVSTYVDPSQHRVVLIACHFSCTSLIVARACHHVRLFRKWESYKGELLPVSFTWINGTTLSQNYWRNLLSFKQPWGELCYLLSTQCMFVSLVIRASCKLVTKPRSCYVWNPAFKNHGNW